LRDGSAQREAEAEAPMVIAATSTGQLAGGPGDSKAMVGTRKETRL
jgi:hypothetical protein